MDLDKLEAYAKHGDMGPYSALFVELIALIRKQEAALQSATTQEIRVVASHPSPSAATVDTSEFYGRITCCILAPNAEKDEEIAGLIAHIDAHVAAQVAAKDAEIKTLTAALDAQGELTDRYQEIALSAQEAAPVVEKPVAWRDALRRCGADTDYHGRIAFTTKQLEQFVNMMKFEPADLQALQQRVWESLDRKACSAAWMQAASCAILDYVPHASQPSPAPVAATVDDVLNEMQPGGALYQPPSAMDEKRIIDIANRMPAKPWGIGSRREDAIAFAWEVIKAAPSPAPVAMTDEKERELFEQSERESDLSMDSDGDYANPCVQSAWEGWKARAILAAQQEAV